MLLKLEILLLNGKEWNGNSRFIFFYFPEDAGLTATIQLLGNSAHLYTYGMGKCTFDSILELEETLGQRRNAYDQWLGKD